MNRRRALLILVVIAGVIVFLTAADSIMAWYAGFQVDEIQGMVSRYGFRGKLLFFGLASIRPFIFMPVTVFFVTGGIIFGTAEGAFWAIAGLTISSTICYWLAYRFQSLFHRIVQKKYIRKVQEAAATNLVSKIFSLRVSPGMPFDIISYASGLTNISYRKFILGTFLGAIPKGILYTYLGDNLDNYLSPETLTVYSILLAIALGPHIYHWIGKRRNPGKDQRQKSAIPPWDPPEC
jgi:uncharacterized membrane protein YdjX (TVP38/TMEM64 family)